MKQSSDRRDLIIKASIGKHLAFAPVAFAVTEGPAHTLLYANKMFQRLQSGGEITIGPRAATVAPSSADLTPLLDRVFRSAETERDAILTSPGDSSVSWSCTVWPVPGSTDTAQKLVIEVRDVEVIEGTK